MTNTHWNETTTAINQTEDTLIKRIITDNWDACLTGLEYPDVGIFYYYTNFKLYKGLHDYSTVTELLRLARNDRERAFAYCYKIHLAEDGVSHNFNVPAAIKKSKLPNYIVHPIQELKIENFYLNPVANRMMERHAEFDDLVKRATGRDWSVEASRLNSVIGGGNFYTQGYAPDSTTWFGTTQNYFYKFIGLFVSSKTSVDYYKMSIEEAQNVLRGQTSSLSPSGDESLKSADSQTQLILYIITFIILIGLYILGWKMRWI